MPLATVVSLLGLAAVLFAVYRDRTVLERGPAAPDWDALPAPVDLGHTTFPLAVPGYDPATVDLHLDRLRRAYTDLYAAAPDDVRAAARASSVPAPPQEPPAPVVAHDEVPAQPGVAAEFATWQPSAPPDGEDPAGPARPGGPRS